MSLPLRTPLALVLVTALPFAQDPAPETAAEPAGPQVPEILAKAFDALRADGGCIVEGRVSRSSADDGAFGSGVIVMSGGPGGGGEPFEGELQVHVRSNGDLLAVSRTAFPGFGLFLGDERQVVQTNFEETPIEVGELSREVEGLLDFDNLLKYSRRADWKGRIDEESQSWTFTADLSKRVLPRRGGGGPLGGLGMGPKVMRVEARLTVDAAGVLTDALFGVVRSDPMAGLRRRIMEEGFEPGGDIEIGDIEIGGAELLGGDDDEEEGETTSYRLRFRKGEPTRRLASFAKIAEELLRSEEF